MKDQIELKSVALLGRRFTEYCTYLQLEDRDLRFGAILDVGAGVSSFSAEAAARGYNVIAADPIYDLAPAVIADKCASDLEDVVRQLPDVAHKYNWKFYGDFEGLRAHREEAYRRFLQHYSINRSRYVTASLPRLPFADKQFQLVLSSHFLFLYDEWFDYEFHKRSIFELARVAEHEIRVYPLTNMRAVKSIFVEKLIHDPDCSALAFNLIKSDFEFFKNSNELLIIRKR